MAAILQNGRLQLLLFYMCSTGEVCRLRVEVIYVMKVQGYLGKSKLFDFYREKINLIGLVILSRQQGSEWKPMGNVNNNNWLGTW